MKNEKFKFLVKCHDISTCSTGLLLAHSMPVHGVHFKTNIKLILFMS